MNRKGPSPRGLGDFAPAATYSVYMMKKKVRRLLIMTTLPLLARVPPTRAEAAAAVSGAPAPRASLAPFVTSASSIEMALMQAAPTIRPEALRAALSAWEALDSRGELSRPLLTVIDYGLPSTIERMWVFDLAARRLLFHELVAHGRNSGEDLAQSFSNEEGSLKTSLGSFVTGTTYNGRNGYSLRLRGMEPGLNDRAEARAIVVHGASYVGQQATHDLGRLGRSYGCPAVRPAIARTLIDEVKDRTLLYAWHPSMESAPASTGIAHTIAGLSAPDFRSGRGR